MRVGLYLIALFCLVASLFDASGVMPGSRREL